MAARVSNLLSAQSIEACLRRVSKPPSAQGIEADVADDARLF